MGNGCEKCCANTDEQSEFNDGQADPYSGMKLGGRKKPTDLGGVRQSREYGGKGSFGGIQPQRVNPFEGLDVGLVIRLQARIRGFLQRRKYKIQTGQMQMANGMYFKTEEYKETLGQGKGSDQLVSVTYQYKCTGAVYTGQMRGGFREGTGTMSWTDGARYEGQWKEGFAHGKGIFYHTDGDIYNGQWMNNKCNGYGVYTNKRGAKYVGNWKNDTQQGQGTETWPEGSKYEGQYEKGQKEGLGTYYWADGSVYTGDWHDNKINGTGQYKWKDGREYYGSWKNNDMDGMGIYIYTDGVTYEGQYKDDKKTGYGLYYWTDGRKYEGWWYKGKQHGLGIYKDPTKNKVKYGLWEIGQRRSWFNEQTIYQINNNQYQYEAEFTDPKSKNHLEPMATFERPANFDFKIEEIKSKYQLQQA